MPVVLLVGVPALLKPALLDDGFVVVDDVAFEDEVRFKVVLVKLPELAPNPE